MICRGNLLPGGRFVEVVCYLRKDVEVVLLPERSYVEKVFLPKKWYVEVVCYLREDK